MPGGCIETISSLAEQHEWLRKLLEVIPTLYPSDDVHGLGHVMRVTCLALQLGRRLAADLEVLVAASLLHDVGRGTEERLGVHHAILSRIIAEAVLRGVGFPEDKLEAVLDAIVSHSFSLGGRPSSTEAAVLSDADKLDAIGAVGIYRASAEGFRRGRGIQGTIRHYMEKLKTLDKLLVLEESRRIARERMRLMHDFFRQLALEASEGTRAAAMLVESLVRSAGAHITAGEAQRRSTSSTQ